MSTPFESTSSPGIEAVALTVLVVEPDAEGPVERFGPWLAASGVQLRTVRPWRGEPLHDRVEADGLLVLGGDMGVHDEAKHPWLTEVRSLMSTAVAEDIPTLGICLGGQLLAAATGGTVTRGAAGMEAGVVEVRALPATREDPLLHDLPWPLLQGAMHRDAITELPPGATWLAESSAYRHQAFRVGACAWGLQFHPEVSPQRYRRWAELANEDELTTARVNAGVAQFEEHDHHVRLGAHALARAFASLVGQRATRSA